VSRGSAIEIDTALDVAFELDYVNKEAVLTFGEKLIRTFQILSKIINN